MSEGEGVKASSSVACETTSSARMPKSKYRVGFAPVSFTAVAKPPGTSRIRSKDCETVAVASVRQTGAGASAAFAESVPKASAIAAAAA